MDLITYAVLKKKIQSATSKEALTPVITEILDESPESLEALQQITEWIENHPDSAAEMNLDINTLKDQMDSVAPEYDATQTYTADSYVWHDGTLYKANTDITTAEAWNSEHWTSIVLTNEVEEATNSSIEVIKIDFNNGSTTTLDEAVVSEIVNNYNNDKPFQIIATNLHVMFVNTFIIVEKVVLGSSVVSSNIYCLGEITYGDTPITITVKINRSTRVANATARNISDENTTYTFEGTNGGIQIITRNSGGVTSETIPIASESLKVYTDPQTGRKTSGVVQGDVDENIASGQYSHAEGSLTTASGYASHAEGSMTTAEGFGSHSEGAMTKATNSGSHSEGKSTVSSGEASHAEGYSTLASGEASHAEGISTIASGDSSHSEGSNTKANHRSQHVFGEFNIEDASTESINDRGNYIEIVGNGTAMTPSNARTLDWNGNESLAGSLTLGMGTENEVTITPQQLQALLALING